MSDAQAVCGKDEIDPELCPPLVAALSCNCPLVAQGAITVDDSTIVAVGASFGGNKAEGSGGGVYCSSSVASFTGSNFTANEAYYGGGGCHVLHSDVWLAKRADIQFATFPESSGACRECHRHLRQGFGEAGRTTPTGNKMPVRLAVADQCSNFLVVGCRVASAAYRFISGNHEYVGRSATCTRIHSKF